MGCFSGRLMSSASDQKLFCELCSVFNCSIDEFVGEKVVSPSYSSAILAPPPLLCFLLVGVSCCSFSRCYSGPSSQLTLFILPQWYHKTIILLSEKLAPDHRAVFTWLPTKASQMQHVPQLRKHCPIHAAGTLGARSVSSFSLLTLHIWIITKNCWWRHLNTPEIFNIFP